MSVTAVGLCASCQFARTIRSAKGSSFWLCRRAETEPQRFAKYPRLPVLRCAGFGAALQQAPQDDPER